MIRVTDQIQLADEELEFSAVRAQGPGGQHVNKVATAIQLRFDVNASSLPEAVKRRLLKRADQRLSSDGVLVIRSQNHRSQQRNREDAIERLIEWIRPALKAPKRRIATRPSRAARRRRLDDKKRRSRVKALRKPVD